MAVWASIVDQMSSGGSKSTVLKPLFFALCFLLACIYFAVTLELPIWVMYCFLIAMLIVFVLFLIIYLVCFFKNPDLIRSEKYLIEKLAIEKQFIGDDKTGTTHKTTINVVAKPDDNSKKLGGGDE